MGAQVVTIEINASLAERAEVRLRQLGYSEDRVQCHTGDGSKGWPEAGPYDAIVVTAAAPSLPESLLSQLAEGGRMVLPIGPPDGIQRLEKWVRRNHDGDAEFESTFVINVQFVPLQSDT
jgi:protein-L-isoaspartate(D-aspartate) O-methyltransferase